MSRWGLALFDHLLAQADGAELELFAALVPEVVGIATDPDAALAALDDLGARCASSLEADSSAEDKIARALVFLYGEEGLSGARDDYYSVEQSVLERVLERRRGIPITLGIVLMGVLRRLGLDAHGVSFPGHFLVRCRVSERESVLLDPFAGRALDARARDELYRRVTGREGPPPPEALAPATTRGVIQRMLANLRGVAEREGQAETVRAIDVRLAVLAKAGRGASAPS